MSAPLNYYAIVKQSRANIQAGIDLLWAWGDLVQNPADPEALKKWVDFLDNLVQKLIAFLQKHDRDYLTTGLQALADKAQQQKFFQLGPPS